MVVKTLHRLRSTLQVAKSLSDDNPCKMVSGKKLSQATGELLQSSCLCFVLFGRVLFGVSCFGPQTLNPKPQTGAARKPPSYSAYNSDKDQQGTYPTVSLSPLSPRIEAL